MKTTIITLTAVALLSISNVFAKDQLYKSIDMNNETHVMTTTVHKGANEKNLLPMKRYVVTSDLNGNPVEKIIYLWNNDHKSWETFQKYSYEYTIDGKLIFLALTKWNKTTDSWSENMQYAVLSNNQSENINLLSIDIESENLDIAMKQNFN